MKPKELIECLRIEANEGRSVIDVVFNLQSAPGPMCKGRTPVTRQDLRDLVAYFDEYETTRIIKTSADPGKGRGTNSNRSHRPAQHGLRPGPD